MDSGRCIVVARVGRHQDDCARHSLVDVAGHQTLVGLVLPDAKSECHRKRQYSRHRMGLTVLSPQAKAYLQMTGVRAEMRQPFPVRKPRDPWTDTASQRGFFTGEFLGFTRPSA
jgi:hypothetical protein